MYIKLFPAERQRALLGRQVLAVDVQRQAASGLANVYNIIFNIWFKLDNVYTHTYIYIYTYIHMYVYFMF